MRDPIEVERAAAAAKAAEPDRRDSRRVPIRLLVRDLALGGSFDEYDGNIGIGGVYFEAFHPPVGSRLELRFIVPGSNEELHVLGEVLRVSREGARFGAHVKFVDIPLDAEILVARFLQRE